VQLAEAVLLLLVSVSVDTKISAFWSARVARWRSTALWHRLVVPPTNQRANGGLL
jgi:hypothetical protein